MSHDSRHSAPGHFETTFAIAMLFQGAARTEMGTPVILLNDLMRHLMGQHPDPERVEDALRLQLPLRRRYIQLLNRMAKLQAPKLVAAASVDEIKQRIGEGFVIKIRESNANQHQVYVILELDILSRFEEGQTLTLHLNGPDDLTSSQFPPLHDNRTHLLVDRDSKLLQLILSGETEIRIL